MKTLSRDDVIRLANEHGMGWTLRDGMDYLNLFDFAQAIIAEATGPSLRAATNKKTISHSGWVQHDGTECPVHLDQTVIIKYRDEAAGAEYGREPMGMARGFQWTWGQPHDLTQHALDIVAYRCTAPFYKAIK